MRGGQRILGKADGLALLGVSLVVVVSSSPFFIRILGIVKTFVLDLLALNYD